MDENVKSLMDSTGCTETEAQTVLQEAGGDVSKALKILDAVKKEVTVFQLKFSAKGEPDSGNGYMVAMFDISSDQVLHSDMAFPLSAAQEKALDINMPPTIFASSLNTIREKLSDRHKAASASNASLIKSKFSSNFIHTVVNMSSRGQKAEVNQRFAQVMGSVLGAEVKADYTVSSNSLDSLASVISGSQHSNLTPEQHAAKLFGSADNVDMMTDDISDLPNASPQEPLPRIVLITEPEISPFHGKPARELIEGDEVIVKIKDGRQAARYFSELLGGVVDDEVIPLCVPVIKTDAMSDTFVETFVEFGPGIFGQFFVPPDVKVKTRDDEVQLYNPFQDEESLFAENRYGVKILVGLGLLFISTVALIIVFLNMS